MYTEFLSRKEEVLEALESKLLDLEVMIENLKAQLRVRYVVNFSKNLHMGFADPPRSPFSEESALRLTIFLDFSIA